MAIQAAVSDSEQAKKLIKETVERFGRIDVLINNAGITIDKTMKKLTTEEWDKVVQLDLNSRYYAVKAALPHFTEQQSGTVVNMSSFVSEAGNFGQTNYATAKAGLIGFTKSAALEMARYNVTVNAICPGFIETNMFAVVPENVKERIRARIPLGRIGEPRDVAKAICFLAEDGDYITGQAISVNGGVYM